LFQIIVRAPVVVTFLDQFAVIEVREVAGDFDALWCLAEKLCLLVWLRTRGQAKNLWCRYCQSNCPSI